MFEDIAIYCNQNRCQWRLPFLKSMSTHTYMTNGIFVYYVNSHFVRLLYDNCAFIRHYWKGKRYPISIFNNFLTFVPNSLVFHFGYDLIVSDTFPLRTISTKTQVYKHLIAFCHSYITCYFFPEVLHVTIINFELAVSNRFQIFNLGT